MQGHREHPLQVLGIGHVDDKGRALLQQDPAGHLLFLGDREQPIHPRRVHHPDLRAVEAPPASGDLHRGAGVVGDRHVGAGQRVEQHALAHVGRADDRHQGQASDLGLGAAMAMTTGFFSLSFGRRFQHDPSLEESK